jgi:hypothetical protein
MEAASAVLGSKARTWRFATGAWDIVVTVIEVLSNPAMDLPTNALRIPA